MTNEETLAAYFAACNAHGDYYETTYAPAAKAHLAGEMADEEYLVIRAAEKELLAAIDPLYAIVSEFPEDEETEEETNQIEMAL